MEEIRLELLEKGEIRQFWDEKLQVEKKNCSAEVVCGEFEKRKQL